MEQIADQFLGREPVGRLMKKYAVPCIISLLVGALYNIVDQIFIANASYLGSYGNAANTVVFPLTVIALAIRTYKELSSDSFQGAARYPAPTKKKNVPQTRDVS